LVQHGATTIAEHPRIPAEQVQLVAQELGEEMAAFKALDTRVHDLSLEIEAAAKVLDGAAARAAFTQMVDGCFACHAAYKERVAAVLNETS
jgi:cytochrome c556